MITKFSCISDLCVYFVLLPWFQPLLKLFISLKCKLQKKKLGIHFLQRNHFFNCDLSVKKLFIFLRISVSFNFPLSWENSLKENYFMILMKLCYFLFHNYLFSSTFLIYRNNLSQIIKWIACSNNREVCWQYLISNYNRSYL